MSNARQLLGHWLRLRRRLWRLGQNASGKPAQAEQPLRSPLFSAEQMEAHGRALARVHVLRAQSGPDQLLPRLRENEDLLQRANALLARMVQDDVRITPAGEWLLDNFYLIEEQVRTARRHLPRNYSRELPALAGGPSAGVPRVYDLAMEAVAHGDGRIDAEAMTRFVAAYQSRAPLTLGELWAIPIMLRLAVIENLRRMAARVMHDGIERREAGDWARLLNQTATHSPTEVVLVVADLARAQRAVTGAFVAELARGVQGRSLALAMPMNWIEQWVEHSGQNVESLVQAESQQQAADQVSVSNSIASLRLLATIDWREFVENLSMVERTLREDPDGTYAQMDFATRDSYRHALERLARRSGIDEIAVARTILGLARAHAGARDTRAHVGHYLVGDGHAQACAAVCALDGARAVQAPPATIPLPAYLLPIGAAVAFFTWGLLSTLDGPVPGEALRWLLVALAVVVFSELGIALVNWLATVLVPPRPLPRLDFSRGMPRAARTLVAVPSMIGSAAAVDGLVEGLEVRFLANRDPYLHFVLLTDFLDADHELVEEERALLDHAVRQIDRLNARYAPEHGGRFFLLHRARRWNPRERSWIGPERKRGKLAALNRLLRGAAPAQEFMRTAGNLAMLGNVRYVITLDTDTRLPRDAAREFAATMAHPLNRPRFDERRRRVTRGYGILQPAIGSSMGPGRSTRYARLFGSEPGIDPYTRTVSDVYQDLFGEGSFVGKGIYDVDAFEYALGDRFPDNSILSHDLLEGCYARAGLVSDVQLFEDPPARYAAEVKRRHRWIRGDWQLLPWLLPWVPRANGGVERNPLSWLSRGKLLDNLRRSLVPGAATALLVTGWALAPAPLAWTAWLLGLWLLPVLVPAARNVLARPPDMALEPHLLQVGRAAARQLQAALVNLACLPYEAWFSLDATARSLWRMAVSRRHLLQWSPSSEVERKLDRDALGELRSMWFAPAFAVAVTLLVAWINPGALWVAAPLLAWWAGSPLLMTWLGRTPPPRRARLSATQLDFLGRLARRTWAFFEVHVRAEDHWLPPDNIQEHPVAAIAHRTSPTNIGLSMLANLAAWDFGYLQAGGVMERTRLTLHTLDALPRHRGHFYNWYDTQTLQPLPPRYISTVDSGNLAGHLLTLRQGLLALPDAPLLAPATFEGLAHTLGVLREQEPPAGGAGADGLDPRLDAFEARLGELRAAPPSEPAAASAALAGLARQAEAIAAAWPYRPADAAEAPALLPDWPQALLQACRAACAELDAFAPWPRLDGGTDATGIPTLRQLRDRSSDPLARLRAADRILELEALAHRVGQYSLMEYGFLYDRSRHLLAIGYDVEERRLDNGYYDLLASEARLGSFVAIAQGQLPKDTWFALGRLLTEVDGRAALLSWSGSMFEYLMPQLVMPSYPDTLLAQTSRHAVEAQIGYGRQRGVPWGISECGYNTVDARMNYQYRAFGVPGLGLKRGLAQDLVIAPYASMMALMVAPEEAAQNLQRLAGLGFGGEFGLYEAIDYTPARVQRGQEYAVVRSFMAHHQGMGLLSLAYLLRERPMQRRFAADPQFQATLLLLQERVPHTGVFHPHEAEAGARVVVETSETRLRVFRNPDTSRPAVQMLSNGRFHGLFTAAGGGGLRLRDMAVTRWREDGTRDHWGSFCYLRDVDSGGYWSAAYQPTCVAVKHYEAIFSDAKAEYRGRKFGFDTHMEIAISAEDDIELRRLRVSNRSRRTRTIEITTYAEVVLAQGIADEAHPAFGNLFVQTELLAGKQALLATRRPRSHAEATPWMFHLVAVHEADIGAISYETDRGRFLGRGNTPRAPLALTSLEPLSGTVGSVLDPIVAIRCRIELAPEQTAIVDMVSGVSGDREGCATLIDKYRDRRLADRVFDLAWTHSQVVRRQINASQADAQLYERLAGLIVYAHPLLRADSAVLLQNRRGQPALWGHSISGDLPIVLVRITDSANIELVRQMVQAHAYWRLKGLNVDMVVWNEDTAGYRQELQERILGMVSAGPEGGMLDRPGGVFVRMAQHIQQEDRILLQAAARVIVGDEHGTLEAQVGRSIPPERAPPLLHPAGAVAETARKARAAVAAAPALPPPVPTPPWPSPVSGDDDPWPFDPAAAATMLDNGTGAFSADGGEYLIALREGAATPAPWCNVLANERFGTVLSESAAGYTWLGNAHEFRLTPWHNDPVADTGGEALYLRDEDSGLVWSPQALPCRGAGDYRTRHGFGYSVYSHVEDGIASELWVYVAPRDAIKFSVLRLRNLSGRARRLSATAYVEWVLGDLRRNSLLHIVTGLDEASGALTARNPYSTESGGRVAFLDVDGAAGKRAFTADRTEFIGRNGSLAAPAALRNATLSGRLGAALDPCAALQVGLALAPGQTSETVFRLGAGEDAHDASRLALRSKGARVAHDALAEVRRHWERTLGAVQVQTPEPELDVLVNGWLLYQTLGCRHLARSGYYQSGGAFGFRDQLQDTMATVHAAPGTTRAHLLASAAHQFPQGDVLHWWHPPGDRGVRTRCSDDFLWLPLAVCRYLEVTGDAGVLDEHAAYVEGRLVSPDEESYYDLPVPSRLREPLYAHCVRALRRGMQLRGERGLPLIGTGDWNDGMNRVGDGGRGESVWLGFFLATALQRFAAVAHARGDDAFAKECAAVRAELERNLDAHAWDGDWYRRAWFDDGTPLGSAQNEECRIDSISQSWAVLSGAAEPARARRAMEALDRHLVRREAGLVQLLDPPFDRIVQDPGYIRGYVPGVRENGGQYTHAAVWAAMAFAQLGDGERAWELARMINPLGHARDAEAVERYKVEPYVMAADVYGVAPHVGRGGWTWYTGSAGWMYRLLTESLLGLERRGDALRLTPCLPADWPGFTLRYRFGESLYRIEVSCFDATAEGDAPTPRLLLDGAEQPSPWIALLDDGADHRAELHWPALRR
ncbi:glucoamylase family protein [Luteimonas sp. RD2P54]|uniref:Glucoamylase family protein n=1 Tax=Luteimonas endophytica TaxID=3042023 RepID=A0ABT6J5X0_9GAMM|nr:glycoside hydrolase family 94 protein [Luteimonas endophytica]MDH5822224.1 glucoamylase family protein [Luteimonas endophytica]